MPKKLLFCTDEGFRAYETGDPAPVPSPQRCDDCAHRVVCPNQGKMAEALAAAAPRGYLLECAWFSPAAAVVDTRGEIGSEQALRCLQALSRYCARRESCDLCIFCNDDEDDPGCLLPPRFFTQALREAEETAARLSIPRAAP